MGEDRVYRQKEMSELFGWSPAWLRRIELLGLLPDLESEPKRGREGRVYSSQDMQRIFWVSSLRHAGIEFAEMREYIDKANELLDLLKKYKTDTGEPLQPVFFHQLHYAAGLFFIDPDKVPASDLLKIGQLAEWLQQKANDLRLQVQHWLIRMDPIFRQMTDIGEQASRSMVSMMAISDLCLKNRLALLK